MALLRRSRIARRQRYANALFADIFKYVRPSLRMIEKSLQHNTTA